METRNYRLFDHLLFATAQQFKLFKPWIILLKMHGNATYKIQWNHKGQTFILLQMHGNATYKMQWNHKGQTFI